MVNSIGRSLALVAALGLTACEDGQGGTNNIFDDIATVAGGGQSAEQRALTSIERKYAQARIGAALAGGVGGALICAIRECTRQQLATAAVLGATAGYVGGVALTRQNQDFRVSQESLNRDLAVARQERQSLKSAADAAQQVVQFQRQEISRLNAGIQSGTVTRDQYRAAYRNMQGDLRATQSLISTGNNRITDLNNSISAHSRGGIDTTQLRSERAAQRRELERLRSAERGITNALRSVPSDVRGS